MSLCFPYRVLVVACRARPLAAAPYGVSDGRHNHHLHLPETPSSVHDQDENRKNQQETNGYI